MKAIIVAGGRGERLRPLTDKIPKPMVQVDGKPILEHVLELLIGNGIKEFIFALCYLPKTITGYFGDGSKWGVNIRYTYESPNNPLGTAGGISPGKKYTDDTFIITYADILRKLDVKEMIRFHKAKKGFATLNIYKRYGPDPKSMILFDQDSRIVEFKERPKPEELTGDFVWANGSFYIFEPQIFDYLPGDQKLDFGKDIFPKLLADGKLLYGFQTDDYFVDIGNLEKLEKARQTYSTVSSKKSSAKSR